MSEMNITQLVGCNFQQIFEVDVQNPQKGTFTNPCATWDVINLLELDDQLRCIWQHWSCVSLLIFLAVASPVAWRLLVKQHLPCNVPDPKDLPPADRRGPQVTASHLWAKKRHTLHHMSFWQAQKYEIITYSSVVNFVVVAVPPPFFQPKIVVTPNSGQQP